MTGAKRYDPVYAARRRKADRGVLMLISALLAVIVMTFGMEPEEWMKIAEGFTRACREVSAHSAQVPDGQMIIHIIDVGQGDSVLVQTAEASILIDAGETGKGDDVVGYLRSAGVEHLDWAVCTHPHSDHLGGMADVLGSVSVDNVMMPVYPEKLEVYDRFYERLKDTIEDRNINAVVPQTGDSYVFGPMTMKVLWPAQWQFSDDLNDWSTVLRFSYGELDFLTCGDLTERGETQLLLSGADIEAEIIKSSHHGSAYSGCDEFLSAAAPEIALVSCGRNNDYGHPHESLLSRYRGHGIKWKRTDLLGDIRVICENGDYTIES